MAYNIGSDKGKEIAKNMTVGSTYKASDGSTWTKKADGSVSVTHQGVTTNNAYKPTSSGSSGSSSGGTTSGRYTSTGGDIGLYGKNQIANGVNWEEVLRTYNDRQNKAITTEGLSQYANDEIQQEMWNYIVNAQKAENQQTQQDYIDNFTYDEEKPTYSSQYDPAMMELLDKILNRDDFSYDAQNDPLYQQYAAMYRQEGDRAMQETLAEAAASAGGMNSYAITAAQQANNYYNSQLNNKIPELYQLAYEMYLQDKESDVQDLGILQGLDDRNYNRYRDTMQDFYNDKNFAYGIYQDAVQQGNWQQNFDYNSAVGDRDYNYTVSQGNLANSWKEKEWDNDMYLQGVEQNRYDEGIKREDELLAQKRAEEQAKALLDLGVMPKDDLLETAEMDKAYATAYLNGVKKNQTVKVVYKDDDPAVPPKQSDEKGYIPSAEEESSPVEVSDGLAKARKDLGNTTMTANELEYYINRGIVVADEEGNFSWKMPGGLFGR